MKHEKLIPDPHPNPLTLPIARRRNARLSILLVLGVFCAVCPVRAVLFRLPLAADTSVHYYFDHGGVKDWKCGNQTYSGHRGTDFSGGPRGKAIYAGAVGTVSSRVDGFGDGWYGNTDGGGFGNHVRLSHAGGFLTIYAHMTVGSPTSKSPGTSVACGEQIGGVGTSGNSTGFHLHFEVRVSGTADDPYQGACGGPLSYWVNQNNGTPTTTCEGGTGTDGATFVSENYPDNTVLSPGQAFTKQFVIKNSGTTTWTANGTNGYTLKHTGNTPSSPNLAPAPHTPVTNNVAPNVNYTFHLPLVAPATPGTYRSNFQMKNSAGAQFGDPMWVQIIVQLPPAPGAPVASAASAVTSSGFTAHWGGVGTATGYRLDVSTNNAFSSFVTGFQNLDVGNVTNQAVGGLIAGRTYYYRVRAYNAGGTSGNSGTVNVTTLVVNPCFGILNPSFEGGFSLAGGGYIASSWTEWETDPGVVIGYDETTLIRSGGHAHRIRVWGGTGGSSGGVFQRVTVNPGVPFNVRVWMYSEDDLTTCSLGVDASGGTNAAAGGVAWSSPSTNVAWIQRTISGTALSSNLTVFLRVATTDNNKRNGYFDDASPSGEAPVLLAQRSGNQLTLTWPECPAAALQRATNSSAPFSWRNVTNSPVVAGGQKSVTLPASGNAGWFRLLVQ